MSASGSVFSGTVQSITTTKLEELSKKRQLFEAQKAAIIQDINTQSLPLERVIILANGVKKCFGFRVVESSAQSSSDGAQPHRIVSGSSGNPTLELELQNLDRFLEQARYDPSVATATLKQWHDTLMRHLDIQSSKYRYATLYGQLVMEWLSSEKGSSASKDDDDLIMSEDYEEITLSGKKLESRIQWEKAVFTPPEVNAPAIKEYLKTLFSDSGQDKAVNKALKRLREAVKDFEHDISHPGQFNHGTLLWTIDGLLQSDLLSDEKRAALKDFRNNELILSELADVLNMRMAALPTWSWGDHVPIEQRRKVTGSYSVYMHEDLLQAIFLQFIGVRWSVFFRNAFKAFSRTDGAWKSSATDIPKAEMEKLKNFLPWFQTNGSLEHKRQELHRMHFELSQLLEYEHQQLMGREGAEEAEYNSAPAPQPLSLMMQQAQPMMQQAQMQPQSRSMPPAQQLRSRAANAPGYSHTNMQLSLQKKQMMMVRQRADLAAAGGAPDEDVEPDEEDVDYAKKKDPIAAKQALLHYIATDVVINRHVHGGLTVFHTVFDSWMPSLPHDIINLVLQFFGVSKRFLAFFSTFLKAPLKFLDDPDSKPRSRQRGTPGAHVLSEVFGETILFCLDYAVNRATNGNVLHRMHDDLWFWSPEHSTVCTAWTTVNNFARVMGVHLNMQKSGSATITRFSNDFKSEMDACSVSTNSAIVLPQGDIRWGFLRLDPTTGSFAIDINMLDTHITDLQKQLESKKSIFSWINAWNSFATTFFTTNFGTPANCYGRAHVDSILSSLARVQKQIFEKSGHGSVVGYLKSELKRRFNLEEDVPDGFLFFPACLGGLDLVNPFIAPLQIRDSILDDPSRLLSDFDEAEAESYRKLRDDFDKASQSYKQQGFGPDRGVPPLYSTQSWHPGRAVEEFLTLDEYTKYREALKYKFSPSLASIFTQLLATPTPTPIQLSQALQNAVSVIVPSTGGDQGGIRHPWFGMDPYWKWVAAMYGPEMMEKFGGLEMVERGSLPVGMVGLLRAGRVAWS